MKSKCGHSRVAGSMDFRVNTARLRECEATVAGMEGGGGNESHPTGPASPLVLDRAISGRAPPVDSGRQQVQRHSGHVICCRHGR